MTEDKRQAGYQKSSKKMRQRWQSRSEEEKAAIADAQSRGMREMWRGRTAEEKRAILKKAWATRRSIAKQKAERSWDTDE